MTSLFEFSLEEWPGPGQHLPLAHGRASGIFFLWQSPYSLLFLLFQVELFNVMFKDMPGCLVEIQSCHGNVACFSKLGHMPVAFFF